MVLLDLFILIPLFLFAAKGFMTGFVKQVLGIAGLVLALVITIRYMSQVSVLFSQWIPGNDTAVLTAAIFLFVSTLIIVNIIATWLDKLLSFIQLNFINRIAGFLFGGLYAAVFISVILLILVGFDLPPEEMKSGSVTYEYTLSVAPAVYDKAVSFWPEARSFFEMIEESFKEINTFRNLPLFES